MSSIYLHAKEFLIDGQWLAIGSFNLSIRSAYLESELLTVFPDAASPPSATGASGRCWNVHPERCPPGTGGP